MNVTDISIVIWIATAIQSSLGIFIYRASKARSSSSFLLTTLVLAAWTALLGFYISVNTAVSATVLVKLAYVLGIIIAQGFLFFFITYPDNKKSYIWLKLFFAALVLVLSYVFFDTDLIIADAYYIGGIAHWAWHFGPLWPLFPLVFFGPFFLGFIITFYRGLKAPSPIIRKSSLTMFWGVLIMISPPTVMNIVGPQFGFYTLIWLGPILSVGWIGVIAYAIVKYEALGIQLIAKRAFVYSLIVAVIGLLITSINFLNQYLLNKYQSFPSWLLYLVSSMATAGIGYFVWLKVRENDVLKYEFVNILTHKLRTPLTQIRWANDALEGHVDNEKVKEMTQKIKASDMHMIELLDSLVTLSDADKGRTFTSEKFLLADAAKRITDRLNPEFIKKNITLGLLLEAEAPVQADRQKIEFVIQTLLYNALTYTPVGGKVKITTQEDKKSASLTVNDSGIGIGKKDLPLIFNKFFRTHNAKNTDTEGAGISLYICATLTKQNGGTLVANSPGENQGSVFTLSLPLAH